MTYVELQLNFNGGVASFSELMEHLRGPFAETYKDSNHPGPIMHDPRITKISMKVSEDCITVFESQVVSGLSTSRKAFWRWEQVSQDSLSFRGRYNGKPVLRLYASRGTKNRGVYNATYNIGNFSRFSRFPEVKQAVFDMYRRVTGNEPPTPDSQFHVVLCRMAFPSITFKESKYLTYLHMPSPLPGVQAATPMEAVRAAFGKKNYRKDLVKAYATADVASIRSAYLLRGLVPSDYLVKVLDANLHISRYRYSTRTVRRDLKHLSEHQRMKLVNLQIKEGATSTVFLEDTFEMINYIYSVDSEFDFTTVKFKSIREFHDTLMTISNKIRTKDREIPPTELAESISKIDWTKYGISVTTATSTHQVIDWGEEMSHCIGSYVDRAVVGSSTLVAIYKDGKLIGNSSFSVYYRNGLDMKDSLRCDQILGKHNNKLPEAASERFALALISEGVVEYQQFAYTLGLDRDTVRLALELEKPAVV